jgi:hypothetical protein
MSNALIEVSRDLDVPASAIFAVLCDPALHAAIDGSAMVQGTHTPHAITAVGQTFISTMHRMGRDYEMINHVVVFEPDAHLAWAPAPGDLDTAGGKPENIGVPAGYRWGYRLQPLSPSQTLVTEYFDCGPGDNAWITNDGGAWIQGSQTIATSMEQTLELLERVAQAHATRENHGA